MMTHPEILRTVAQEHRQDMLDDAEKERLLTAARRYRRVARRRHR
jgi:hypothetical protein